MDWKYKHFHQERKYPAAREVVLEAARRFMSEALGWKVEETADGFIAAGYSFYHAAIANFRFGPGSEQGDSASEKVDIVEMVDIMSTMSTLSTASTIS